MNSRYRLSWETFDWSEFQRLCILIAQYKFPECDFQEYLKQGHKQHGTDLLSFDYRNGSLMNVQCKHVKKMSEADILNIVHEFTSNDLVKKTTHFILATSFDINSPLLTKAILKIKENLRTSHQIQFHCWGKTEIEKYLEDNWRIVYKYFGRVAADEFCIPQLKNNVFNTLKPVIDYIPRKIFQSTVYPDGGFAWSFNRQLEDLIEILTSNVVISRKICIIGDAYQGKSSYLKQTAFLLKDHNLRLYPLLIDIKDVIIGPIEDILNQTFGQWKSIPLKDIIFFIDGLDEAPTDKFREMVKYIKLFAKDTPYVNIVISCRKQFYNQLGVREELEQFEAFELFKIQEEQRDAYLQKSLTGSIPKFLALVKKRGIIGFLDHPFYLVNLVEEYNISQNIPESKIGVIELFIKKAYDSSLGRRLKQGQILQDELYKFKQVIARFALALQFAGVNAFKYEEVQQIFNTDDRELLQHNSMIGINDSMWSFTNAMFQEHFAALLLSKLTFNQIKEYATVGVKFKKIRAKWIQTISSLLSILRSNNSLFNQIFNLIKNDNIELLFQGEPSKFDGNFKKNLLENLVEKCIQTNTRPVIVYEDTISNFIDGVNPAIAYLISCLTRNDITEHIKDVCIRILRPMEIPDFFKDEILKAAVQEIKKTSDAYYAGQLIQLLASHNYGDQHLLDKLIKYFPESHEYRDDIYELIITLNLHEQYYNYALEGMPYLLNYNKKTSHHGSWRTLEELLLATNSRSNFWKLFKKMQDSQWLEFYQHRTASSEDFVSRLFAICTEFYKTDPLIILPIAAYIETIGRQNLRHEFKEVDQFLEKTDSHYLAVRLLINKIFEDNSWEIGAIITSDSYDYILFEFEESNKDFKSLRNCISGLRYKKKEEISNQFSQLCDDATEGRVFDKTHWGEHEEYLKLENQRKENDRTYVISVENFREGVIKYFNAYGKKTIPENDLYVEVNDRFERKQFDSNFVFRFLIKWRRNNASVYLRDCLKFLDNKHNFEYFRAEEIINYTFDNESDKKFYYGILKEYYYKQLATSNFENCKWNIDNNYHWKPMENMLGDIFKKFEFETSEEYLTEMIWLDESGISSLNSNIYTRNESLSELIIKKLSNSGVQKLKRKILLNIRNGIKSLNVLGTHLALCRHFKIKEAKYDILKIIQNEEYRKIYLGDIVDIYLELGGDINEIVELISKLVNYNEYWYLHLIKLISPNYTQEAIISLTKALLQIETNEEVRIDVAKHLASLGDLRGFKFLIKLIRENKKSPYSIQGQLAIHNVDTTSGLKELEDLMYLVVDEKYKDENHFSESASNILIELLYGFAGKSETDLEKVIEFCEKAMNDLKKKHDKNATDFNFFMNRMTENFRSSEKTSKNIFDIKNIIENLTY